MQRTITIDHRIFSISITNDDRIDIEAFNLDTFTVYRSIITKQSPFIIGSGCPGASIILIYKLLKKASGFPDLENDVEYIKLAGALTLSIPLKREDEIGPKLALFGKKMQTLEKRITTLENQPKISSDIIGLPEVVGGLVKTISAISEVSGRKKK